MSAFVFAQTLPAASSSFALAPICRPELSAARTGQPSAARRCARTWRSATVFQARAEPAPAEPSDDRPLQPSSSTSRAFRRRDLGCLFAAAAAGLLLGERPSSATATSITGPFHNRYFIVRHAEAKPNAEGFVCSDPVVGTAGPRCGLTEAGRQMAKETAHEVARIADGGRVLIYSSDFTRTQSTAEIIAGEIGGEVRVALELRERAFGELEGRPTRRAVVLDGEAAKRYDERLTYDAVWDADEEDPSSHYAGSESVLEVFGRVSSFINSCEKAWKDKRIVLVSHGDTLQILQAAVAGRDPRWHREFAMKLGEARPLLPRDA